MNKKFVALTVASVGTIVVSISAQAGALAIDAAGNLFLSDEHSIYKFAPDGTKSTFATGLDHPTGLAADAAGSVYVTVVTAPDASSHAILKFGPDGTKSTFTSLPGSFFAGDLAFDRSAN